MTFGGSRGTAGPSTASPVSSPRRCARRAQGAAGGAEPCRLPIVPPTVAALQDRLEALAQAGSCARFGGACSLALAVDGIGGAAVTGLGVFDHNPDNVVLMSVRCGNRDGILSVAFQGNDKDEGCAVSSGQAAVAFVDTFRGGLLSEADIGPTLRRAMLTADALIRALVDADPHGFDAKTAAGPRRSLSGIGTCVTAAFALPGVLHVAHVGDSCAVLRRGPDLRKLTQEHTLANDRAFRAHVRAQPEDAAVGVGVVLCVLGLGPEPKMDVSRLQLLSGDQVLVGNLALPHAFPRIEDLPRAPETAASTIVRAMTDGVPWSPATVAVMAVNG